MKYIRYVKSQCPGVLGGMYFWMYFLYLMHFLYKTETRNLFLMQEVFQMEGIEKVCQFLDEAHVYYLATVEGEQPRCRPFGTSLLYDGKLYIQTGKVKDVSKQIAVNPKVEICAFNGGKWLRVAGELVNDDSRDVKVAMLEKFPTLKSMYSADDDNTQVLYFKNAVATFSSFTEKPEVIKF